MSHDDTIRFLHRGSECSLQPETPVRTVLQALREDLHCTGTKEGCAEGDCGACTVLVAHLDADDRLVMGPVNACIRFLPSLEGCALFTVEDLAAPDGTLHPVQQAMLDTHGSQCGFCTPGFIMALWQLYLTLDAAHPQGPLPEPDARSIADALSGNLCRCTGYRPIVEAARRMVTLPRVHFDRAALVVRLQALRAKHDEAQGTGPRLLRAGADVWHAPQTEAQLVALRAAHPQAQLVAGATDVGLWVTKQLRPLGDLIWLGGVAELRHLTEADGWLEIGAAVSLEAAYARLAALYPEGLDTLWRRFASAPVRQAGTLVGNVANGSPIGDSMPWLLALGARVVLRGPGGVREMNLDDFYLDYRKTALAPDEFVRSVRVPLPRPGRVLRCYKVAKRFDQDISAVCAGFMLEPVAAPDGPVRVRMAFGGMAGIPRRALHAESYLQAADWRAAAPPGAAGPPHTPWLPDWLENACAALDTDFAPLSDMRASAEYRRTVARNLLRRFWLETGGSAPHSVPSLDVFQLREAS